MSRIEELMRNTETVVGAEELQERVRAGKRLKVKLGVDPTRPDLTFGHMVVFNKMRQFQDLGHDCILLIGDYTATIGDPSGRSATRPVLTDDEVRENAQTYLDQAFKVLDSDRTIVRYNSEWFSEMSFGDCLNLARKMTVARMLERDDFAKRYQSHAPISIVEFLYPLVQGYDSVMLGADVELGGSDQLFNCLVGRQLQKDAGHDGQIVMTMPLLVGLDGIKKMSKSQDNFIAFNDTPRDMFGKVMSISDETMWDYYRLLLLMDEAALERHKAGHPMDQKKHLASSLVGMFHSMSAAKTELEHFETVFSKNQLPSDMPEFSWEALTGGLESEPTLLDLMDGTKLFPSRKEIRRLGEQRAIKLDGNPVNDARQPFPKPAEPVTVQAGKRTFFRLLPE
ncbi:MAG: tyrosine--tRNA ligase [Opitutales bacterium]